AVRKIAAPAARDQDLLADTLRVLDHRHPAATFAGFDRAKQARGARADNDRVERQNITTAICPSVMSLSPVALALSRGTSGRSTIASDFTMPVRSRSLTTLARS